MKPTMKYIVLGTIACALASGAALAQKTVQGEMWRTKMSMQSQGFSMPARTMEVCMPPGKPEEAAIKQNQDQNSNCTISNFRQSGNKTSADIKCTGSGAMEGHWEIEKLSETSMRGKMDAKTADGDMSMQYEYTRLGAACEVKDYSDYKPPAQVAQTPQIPDTCQQAIDGAGNTNATQLLTTLLLPQHPSPDGTSLGDCTKHKSFQSFCAIAQSPAGFSDLEFTEWKNRDQPLSTDPNLAAWEKTQRNPLSVAMQACGLGSGPDAVAKLQAKAVSVAEKENRWGFLLRYAADAYYPKIAATAKAECSGRSFTSAANAKYAGLCRSYGTALARDDRAAVLGAAGCSQEREDVGRGICVGATAKTVRHEGGDADDAGAVAASASSGSTHSEGTSVEDEKTSAKDKAKKTLKKIGGLFGN